MKLAILGSTGSIGRQTLDVVRSYPELMAVELLTAGDNWELLARQALEFDPWAVVIGNEHHYEKLKQALSHTDIKVYAGAQAIEQTVVSANIDTVVVAIVGFAGLGPTLAAIRGGKKLALANKESLVVAGELVMPLSGEHRAPIIPVDSEHSAIFQCLVGESAPIKRVIITASGGALREMTPEQAQEATVEQVLKHPCWEMGAKITVDSATMLNKGFEVIEAHWLFGLSAEQIDVVIHPQSIIHSFVEFEDGALKAQLSQPDMRLPIQYALTFPQRMPIAGQKPYNPMEPLTFAQVDKAKYPCLELAYNVLRAGGIMPTVLNAAGEVAVHRFLAGQIKYSDIFVNIDKTLQTVQNEKLQSLEQIIEIDRIIRKKIWK